MGILALLAGSPDFLSIHATLLPRHWLAALVFCVATAALLIMNFFDPSRCRKLKVIPFLVFLLCTVFGISSILNQRFEQNTSFFLFLTFCTFIFQLPWCSTLFCRIVCAIFIGYSIYQVVLLTIQLKSFGFLSQGVTGSFTNCNSLAAYFVITLPVLLWIVWKYHKKWWAIPIFAVYFFLLLSLQSRIAWFNFILILLFSLAKQYPRFFKLLHCYRKIFSLSLILLAMSLLGLNIYSSSGRFLGSIASIQLICRRPLFGHGFGSFPILYPAQQGKLLTKLRQPFFDSVADFIRVPFNELLRVGVEGGIIASICFIWLVFFAIKMVTANSAGIKPFLLCSIAGIATTSAVSYPFNSSVLLLVAGLMISWLSNREEIFKQYTLRRFTWHVLNGIFFIGLCFFVCSIFKTTTAAVEIKSAQVKSASSVIGVYEKNESLLTGNSRYLVDLAGLYYCERRFDQVVYCLKQAESFGLSESGCLRLIECYFLMKKYAEAEKKLTDLIAIVPNRFYPRYLLVKTMLAQGRKREALDLANKTLKLPIKVNSPQVAYLRKQLQKVLDLQSLK
jgi:hypothetical protein